MNALIDKIDVAQAWIIDISDRYLFLNIFQQSNAHRSNKYGCFSRGKNFKHSSINQLVTMNDDTVFIQEEDGISINNPGGIIYVNQDATGNNDGTSWENAYTDLQPALETSQAEDQIWVAAGTYLPTTDGDRDISFRIKTGTEVYGGFAGGETELSQRDWINNQVILSGNIGNSGDRTDNSHHVVNLTDTSFFTIFDGFSIVDGYAVRDSTNGQENLGGGIYADFDGNAELKNLIIANNFASSGGGAYFDASNVNLNNTAFFNNNSSGSGGGFYAGSSSGEINNALFANNRADFGGAIYGDLVSNLDITNSTFEENQADTGSVIGMTNRGGGVEGVNFTNSIIGQNPVGSGNSLVGGSVQITVNQSIVQGGFEGAGQGIIDADPLFVDPESLNFSLQPDSPAVDAGDNTAVEGISTDLVGNTRITNDTVDLGAYELVLTADDVNQNPDTPSEETPDTPPEDGDGVAEGDPVYRFFIPDTGVHFYTADESERDEITETQPDYVLEGTPYNSAPAVDSLTGVAPIYRFLNTDTGVRIYTIAEAERESIETLPNYEAEGIAYYGYTEQLEDTTPVFRFYNPTIDAHFYTSSAVERDSVIENLPDYQLESNGGVAFYVEPIFTSGTPAPEAPSDPVTDSSLPQELGAILNSLGS